MRIEKQTVLSAPPAEVWKSLGDPVALGRFSDHVQVHRQPGTDAPGVGARYRVLLTVGAVPVGGNVEVIVYEPERELQWTTVTGVDHRLRLRLRETDEGGTRLTLRFAYDSPGIFGTAADLASFVPVSRIMDDVLANIAGQL